MYGTFQAEIADYEKEILRKLAEMEREDCRGKESPKLENRQKTKAINKRGEEPMHQALLVQELKAHYRISGNALSTLAPVDLAAIDAIGVETIQVVLSEYGPDLSRFPTEKQFVSHVTLASMVQELKAHYKPTSGGKAVKKKKRGSASTRVAAALRMAALSLRHSDTALGAYYRQIARRIAADVAVFSTARKLATLIYWCKS